MDIAVTGGARLRMAGLSGFAALALGLGAAQAEPAGGSWSTAAPLPDERTEVFMTTDGARLYLAGGFAPGEGRPTAPTALYAYDPNADGWELLTDLPEGVNHAPMVYLDGRLFVVGGYREATFDPIDSLRIYDIAEDSWQDGPPLPTARGALAATVHDGRIHALGGVDLDGENTGAHEVFDPETESWSSAAPLPTPRDHHAAASVQGEIVVIAGRNPETELLRVNEIYDPESDSWRGGADVPTGRSGVAAVELDGLVYLFGGEQFDPADTFDEAERYDPAQDEWVAMAPMPTARHGLGAAVMDGRIHVVSGGPGRGLTYSDVHEVLTPEE